jgi:hypothetical protein
MRNLAEFSPHRDAGHGPKKANHSAHAFFRAPDLFSERDLALGLIEVDHGQDGRRGRAWEEKDCHIVVCSGRTSRRHSEASSRKNSFGVAILRMPQCPARTQGFPQVTPSSGESTAKLRG